MTTILKNADYTSPEQVLMWHNLSLEAARELGDSNWVQQTYADFDMHCEAMTLTTAQQIALAVTRLRMELNDGLLSEVDSYAERITKLLDRVHLLPEADQLPALKEITHNLEQVMQRVSNMQRPIDDYLQVYTRCDQMVLERAHIIAEQLHALVPTLINQRQFWLSLKHQVSEVHIRRAIRYPGSAFADLFESQQESAELHKEKGIDREALHAWMVICDEYIAYMHQIPPDWASSLRQQHEPQVLESLVQAEALLRERQSTQGLEDVMIQLAACILILRKDKVAARHWIQRFDESGMNLNHYAQWLRDKHHRVKETLMLSESR